MSLYDDLLNQIQDEAAQSDYENTLSQIKSYSKRIEEAGYTPPPEESPGFIQTFFEAIDKPRGAVAGGIANLLNIPGYQGDFLDSVKSGWRKPGDIGGSEFIKAAGVTGDDWLSKGIRGVGGFGIDIMTDPLNAITLGGGAGAKVAGKTLSSKALKLASGEKKSIQEILESVSHKAYKSELDKISQGLGSFAKDTTQDSFDSVKKELQKLFPDRPEADLDTMIGRAYATSSLAGQREVRSVAALLDEQKRLVKSSGLLDEVAELPVTKQFLDAESARLSKDFGIDHKLEFKNSAAEFNTKAQILKDNLGLASDVDLKDLFNQPGLRFNLKYIPVVGDMIAPALGKEYIGDIPLITELTGKAFELTGKGAGKINDGVNSLLEWGSKLPVVGAPIGIVKGVKQTIGKVPRLISRTAQAGSRARAETLKEYEVQQSVLKKAIDNQAEEKFRYFGVDEATGKPAMTYIPEEDLHKASELYQTGFVFKDDVPVWKQTENGFWAHIDDNGAFAFDKAKANQALQEHAAKMNAAKPGSGDAFLQTTKFVTDDMERMAKIEQEMGLLGAAREGYLTGIYKDIYGINPDTALAKKFTTLQQAQAAGYRPETNIKEIWKYRRYAHERALLQKEYMERLMFDHGLNAQGKIALTTALKSVLKDSLDIATKDTAAKKLSKLRQFAEATGYKGGIEDLLTAENRVGDAIGKAGDITDVTDPILGIARAEYKHGYVPVTPELYNRYANAVNGLSTADPKTLEVDLSIAKQLHINGSEAERAKYLDSWQKYQEMTRLAPDIFGTKMLSDAGSLQLPKHQIKALERHIRGNKNARDLEFFTGVLPEQLVKAAKETFDTKTTYQKLADSARAGGDTHFADAIEGLGKNYFTLLSWLKQGATKYWPAYHIRNAYSATFQGLHAAQNFGSAINPYTQYEIQKLLFSKNPNTVLRLKNGHTLTRNQFMAEAQAMGITVDPNAVSDTVGLMNGVVNAQKSGIASKIHDSVNKFGQAVEQHGRLHLYYKLRKNGYTPAQAAQETQRALIDYAHGKTAFEKHVLNNVMFFYSFLRGETANTLTSMLARPGVLSTQYQAHKAISNIISDPNAYFSEEEKELAQTSRTKDSLSALVGRNKNGDPIVMTSTGIPAEEVFRNLGLRMPQSGTPAAVAQGFFDTAKSAAKNQMAAVNPILRRPIEMLTNHSFFFDRPLTDRSLRKFPKLAQDFKRLDQAISDGGIVPEAVYDTIDATTKLILKGTDNGDGTYTVSPYRLAMLSFVPGMDRLTSTYSFARKGKDRIPETLARLTTGIRTMDVDVEKSVAKDRVKQLEAFIEEKGIPSMKASQARRKLLQYENN